MKLKTINGYTKEKILEVIRARRHEEVAVFGVNCKYLTDDGNRCAIGLFIPPGHPGEHHEGAVKSLLKKYPDLKSFMPIEEAGLESLQIAHDNENPAFYATPLFEGNAKAAMIAWVEKNVED